MFIGESNEVVVTDTFGDTLRWGIQADPTRAIKTRQLKLRKLRRW
jgi:hypothetical protein